ncbi:hypothetical protein CMO88_01065 [Candidatus Woesearchaeota archaeon]|nr:hypothetical protein [Candidatus Woesearchaeota archaeon]|tara:strand:+ start:8597 stop:10501 length:1905 start_codon:yes stop_codon:yes gene_type:complete
MGFGFIVLFYALLALFGFLFLKFWKNLDDFERAVLSFPFGSALYAMTAFVLSEFIGIKLNVSVLSLLLAAMLIIVIAFNLFLKNLKIPRPKLQFKFSFVTVLLTLFIIAMSLHALAVPIYKQDAYMYHLPFAEKIYETGHLPDINPSVIRFEYAYPPYQYMMYAFTSFFNGSMTAVPAKILPLIFGLLLLALLYRTTRTFADRETSLFAVLLFTAAYYYSNMIFYSNTDITTAFYVVAAIYILLKIVKQPLAHNYLLFSMLTAMAYWTKYTAIAPLIIAWVILAAYSFASHKKKFLISVAVVLLFISPYFIRNILETGNPLYPGLSSLFGGKGLSPWYEANILSSYLPKPFSTFNPVFFFKLSYLLLPLTAVSLFMRKKLSQRILLIFAISYIALWFLFLRNPAMPNTYRYLTPAIISFSAVAAPAFVLFLKQELNAKMKKVFFITSSSIIAYLLYLILIRKDVAENIVLIAVVFIAIAFSLTKINLKFASAAMLLVFLAPSALSLHVQPLNFSEELFSDVTYQSSGKIPLWIDSNLPDDAKILYFFEYPYLVPRTIIPADDPSVQKMYVSSKEETYELLKELEITHVYSLDDGKGAFRFFSKSAPNINLAEPEFTLLYNETFKGKIRGLYRVN